MNPSKRWLRPIVLWIFCLLQVHLATANEIGLAPGDYQFSLYHDGQTRHYTLHIPKTYLSSNPAPLVISMHGGGGNMSIQSNDDYYHLISKSEEAGFIAVFPNGYSRFPRGKLATWNAGICCGLARDQQSDDVGFIRKVIEEVKQRVHIKQDRIYANGMSNGGMMAYRLACEMSDTIRAIVSVAGTDGTGVHANTSCTPSRPVSVMHIHALNDERVLYYGGSGSRSKTHADFVSVPDSIKKWVTLNQCQPEPKRVLSVKGAYCDLYDQCSHNTQVKLCVTEEGGHAWPGGKKPRGGTSGSSAINATDLLWDFYQTNR